jgi:hypothetical protein
MFNKTNHGPELDNVKKATAMMFAALVDTLVGTDSIEAQSFVKALDDLYTHIRNDSDDINALELISWTKSMISGIDRINGQQAPLMKQIHSYSYD